MDIELGVLERVELRDVWKSEPGDFTPWLSRNLDRLGKALGLDLEISETEAAVGDFACDITALDVSRSRRVIIENQLEFTDHRHLGQLLTYAAGLDAAVVIWVSRDVREEHRQAIDWLNRHTGEDIEFFAVVVELVRIGNSVPAVQFRAVASPNAWGKQPALMPKALGSEKGAAYQSFFQALIDQLRVKYAFTNAKIAQPQNWYSFGSGVTGVTYTATFAQGARLRAQLYIGTASQQKNEAAFDFLFARKQEIEEEIGGPLEWERLNHRRASRISLDLANTDIEVAVERQEETLSWLVGSLLKFRAVFGPRLDGALSSIPQAMEEPAIAE